MVGWHLDTESGPGFEVIDKTNLMFFGTLLSTYTLPFENKRRYTLLCTQRWRLLSCNGETE